MQIINAASSTNAEIITEYLKALQTETNSSKNYTLLSKQIIAMLSKSHKDLSFANMKRNDVIIFLNSLRKSDKQDPMHKWIGTYNAYLIGITRFFK